MTPRLPPTSFFFVFTIHPALVHISICPKKDQNFVSGSISWSIFFFPLFLFLENNYFLLSPPFSDLRAWVTLYHLEGFIKTIFT